MEAARRKSTCEQATATSSRKGEEKVNVEPERY
jgi:hypothetical protein